MTIHNAQSASWTVRTVVAAMLSYALMAPALSADAEDEEVEELDEVQITGTRIQAPGQRTSANPDRPPSPAKKCGGWASSTSAMRCCSWCRRTSRPTRRLCSRLTTRPAPAARRWTPLDRSSFFIGNTIANLRGLDPTFGSRTLTLVDGRRVVSTSNQADVVDLNIIPSNLLQRMDVVTGGASATYGSGAMAGVVNLVLNNRLTGFNLDMDYGINEAGDGGSPHISASGGMPLFGGRGHALIGVEWQKQSAIRDCAAARDWCARVAHAVHQQPPAATSNPARRAQSPLPGFEDLPARFQMGNVRYSQFAPEWRDLSQQRRELRIGLPVHRRRQRHRGIRLRLPRRHRSSNVMNGDGPLVTSGHRDAAEQRPQDAVHAISNSTSPSARRPICRPTTPRPRARTSNATRPAPACVRFDTPGAVGNNAAAGDVLDYSSRTVPHCDRRRSATGAPTQRHRAERWRHSLPASCYGPGGPVQSTTRSFPDIPGLPATGFGAGAGSFPARYPCGSNPAVLVPHQGLPQRSSDHQPGHWQRSSTAMRCRTASRSGASMPSTRQAVGDWQLLRRKRSTGCSKASR